MQCGTPCEDDEVFCHNCGARLKDDKAEEQKETTVTDDVNKDEKAEVKKKKPKAPKEPKPKKNGKVGIIVLVILALLCMAGGFGLSNMYFQKSGSAIKRMEVLYEDDTSITQALVFQYDESYMKGTLSVIGTQGQVIAEIIDAQAGKYYDKTDAGKVVYLNQDNQLCIYDVNTGNVFKISDTVVWDSITVSDNGRYMIVCISEDVENITYVYDTDSEEKLKAATGYVHDIAFEDNYIYMIDESNNFIRTTGTAEKDTIKGNVTEYTLLDNGKVFFQTSDGSDTMYYLYNGDTSEKLRFTDVLEAYADNYSDIIVCLAKKSSEEENTAVIYVHTPENQNLEIEKDISKMAYSGDTNIVYYIKSGSLYMMQLPDYTGNLDKYQKELDKTESFKITSDCMEFMMSPNGENIAYLTEDGTLGYMYYQDDDKNIIASNVVSYRIYDKILTYTDADGNIFRNSFTREAHDKQVFESESIGKGTISTDSRYGEYFAYKDNDTLVVLNGENERMTIVPYISDYDHVIINGMVIYDKTLKYSSVVGRYYLLDMDVMMELTAERKCSLYAQGEKQTEVNLTVNEDGNNKIGITSSDGKTVRIDDNNILTSDSAFTLQYGGTTYWNVNGELHPMLKLTQAESDKVLHQQQEEIYQTQAQEEIAAYVESEVARIREEKRIAAEKAEAEAAAARAEAARIAREAAEKAAAEKAAAEAAQAAAEKAALEEKKKAMNDWAKTIVANGVYTLNTSSMLYNSANFTSETGTMLVGPANYYVSRYSISDTDVSNGNVWFYVKYKWMNTTWKYGWVCVKY
jgi:hypothetical protein